MESREFKDFIYNHFSKVSKAFSSPKRFELLDLLSQSPKTVEVLAKETSMSVANTSKHLQSLLESRLVTFKKEKNFIIYELVDDSICDILSSIKALTETQMVEVKLTRLDYISKPYKIEALSIEDLPTFLEGEMTELIDVRPSREYEAGHIPGAKSIPITELKEMISSLSKDKKVIAYCRGPHCVYATEAVEYLKEQGYTAYLLEASVHDWKQINQNN
ncbi:ArsR/SmtB family transcription factor [Texcoconibacillus texcoconensis]|uniref:Rhodanese-related sulfurtransferase n=1 Tax=Texcoconibacillus texcoconensis TaxID=1095777 RepID=A0A840QC59_9BACI|nr:rhodanese-like domain-containing protein [Texcoconibacillus texcoconensis]MBB5171910.1 rhodanese-related sulfurtransferase [Texcoconibacillus texcoconensis]